MISSKSTACRVVLPTLLGLTALSAHAQQNFNTITTAVPVLTIPPDARSAGIGDASVAISPDANSAFYNAGKLGFLTQPYGGSLSYSPWLRGITDDMGIGGVSGFYKLNPRAALSLSLMYFDLGEIQYRDANNIAGQTFNPKEYTISVAYGQKLSDNLGVGVAARFIHSNLTGSGDDTRPGNAAAVDLGVYYNKDLTIGASEYNLALGGAISNIGNKITYTRADQADFLPTNLKLGTAITRELDAYNKITFTVDANKLLVPTPYYEDNVPTTDPGKTEAEDRIRARNEEISRKGVVSGMLGSFSDAPGGFREELREINLSTGLEYWYNDLLAARVGYFYESPKKGDRQYLSMGLGLRYQVFGVDAAYLVPNQRSNPLAQTVRVSLHFNFNGNQNDTPATDSGTPLN